MASRSTKCGHKTFSTSCQSCKSLQLKWYAKLEQDPEWKDIEYGLEQPAFVYQPVNVKAIDPLTTEFYDLIWGVYHLWVKEGRSKRDCAVAELLAKQEGESGTVRGIMTYLKSKNLTPASLGAVHRTTEEICSLIGQKWNSHTLIVEQGASPLPCGLQTDQGRSQWPSNPSPSKTILRRPKRQSEKQPSTPTAPNGSQPTSTKATG